MSKDHPTIEELRLAIDAADEIIIRALQARFRAIEALHDLKSGAGMPVEDLGREENVKALWKAHAKALNVPEHLALLILDFILAESKKLQSDE